MRWRHVTAAYAALTLLYVWPLLRAFGSRLPSDTGDPGLNTWILWWNAHAVPLSDRWWNAPIFYPVSGAFAFSETLLSLTLVSTPIQWLGGSAIVAYNAVFVVSYFSAALASHALAHRLTGRHDIAFLAGIAFGFSPYRAAQLPHIQMLVSCWMPLALLALHRYLDERRHRDAIAFGVCWILNALTSGYYLVYFTVLVGLWVIWFVRTRRDALAIGVTLLVVAASITPWLLSYQRHQQALGMTRAPGEIEGFGADLSALWATSSYTSLARYWTLEPRPEGELYPGVAVLVIVLAGVIVAWRARSPATPGRFPRVAGITALCGAGIVGALAIIAGVRGGWQIALGPILLSATRPFKIATAAMWLLLAAGLLSPRLADGWRRRSPFFFYSAAALAMFVLAWGPVARAFEERFWYQAPYALLMQLPGGHALRVPARFAMPMMLCLSQAAALAAAQLTARRPRHVIVGLLASAIALDGWIFNLKTDPVPAAIDLSGVPARVPVLEIPASDLYADTAAMIRATRHGHPLINGYSGYEPSGYSELRQGLQEFNPSVFDAFRARGPICVFVDRARDSDGRYAEFVRNIPGATVVRESSTGTVFLISARGAAIRRESSPGT